jgi:hypothetical protein
MRRAIVGILGLMLCSTAQAESWTGRLERTGSEGYTHPAPYIRLYSFSGRGWRCTPGRGAKICSTASRLSDRCGMAASIALSYRGRSGAYVLYACDGETVGETYYQGRLRYSRR